VAVTGREQEARLVTGSRRCQLPIILAAIPHLLSKGLPAFREQPISKAHARFPYLCTMSIAWTNS
jgi:hypothetical protein